MSSLFFVPPPPQPPPPPLQPTPPSHFKYHLHYHHSHFKNFFFQQQPLFNFSQPSRPGHNIFGSQTQELHREEKPKSRVLEEIDEKILKLPDPPKIELGDALAHVLGTEANNILEDKYLNSKELGDKTLENIKGEYNFNEIKDAFDEASVPNSLQFFYGGDNDEFIQACNFLLLNKDNNEFVSFLASGMGQNIMANNSLLIHIETGKYIL